MEYTLSNSDDYEFANSKEKKKDGKYNASQNQPSS